jgi:hypothetical protein
MLGATPQSKRLLEVTQFVLTFIGTCTVVDAARVQAAPSDRPGYSTSAPLERAREDRRYSDLARADRKRREAEQQASRRSGTVAVVTQDRQQLPP